jgi:hypothetical protein
MAQRSRESHIAFLLVVGLVGWFVPGGGHLMINEKKHAFIIFVTIALTFAAGLYIGSIGIINPVGAKPWYVAQVMNSPLVAIIGRITAAGDYPVYGRPNEIGQIYTSIAGLLNLLCIVNAVYWGHLRRIGAFGE